MKSTRRALDKYLGMQQQQKQQQQQQDKQLNTTNGGSTTTAAKTPVVAQKIIKKSVQFLLTPSVVSRTSSSQPSFPPLADVQPSYKNNDSSMRVVAPAEGLGLKARMKAFWTQQSTKFTINMKVVIMMVVVVMGMIL
jgi:hypothetical protein